MITPSASGEMLAIISHLTFGDSRMRIRSFCTALLLGTTILFSFGADEPREAGKQDLHHNMEAMEKPFKQLGKQISDSSKNESSLQLVLQLQQLTLASKSQIPRKVDRMPATQQAEAKSDYRQMMVNLLRQELDLEEQLINGDNKKAAETVAAMDQLQKDGHAEFRPKRGERGERGEH